MTLEQRMTKLERQLRWHKRLGALAIAVALGVVVVAVLVFRAKESEPQELWGKSLSLVDSSGNLWADISDVDGDRSFHIWRSDGSSAIEMFAMRDGSTLIELKDRETRPRISIWTSDGGSPALWMRDGDLNDRLRLDDGSIKIADVGGEVIWKAPGE
jgi:hypothetical protein